MISAIVAISNNDVIGKNGLLPWPHIKEDMEWFKSHTINNVIVMGSKTWSSFGSKILKNRNNIVISNRELSEFPCADDVITHNLPDDIKVLSWLYPNKEIFVIGGAQIYKLFAPLIDTWYITRIDENYEGDVSLNIDELIKEFTLVNTKNSLKWKKGLPKYKFEIYKKDAE